MHVHSIPTYLCAPLAALLSAPLCSGQTQPGSKSTPQRTALIYAFAVAAAPDPAVRTPSDDACPTDPPIKKDPAAAPIDPKLLDEISHELQARLSKGKKLSVQIAPKAAAPPASTSTPAGATLPPIDPAPPPNDLAPNPPQPLTESTVSTSTLDAPPPPPPTESALQPSPIPAGTTIFAGCITRIDAGNAVERMAGMGLGASYLTAHIRVLHQSETALTAVQEFTVEVKGSNLLPPLGPIGLVTHAASAHGETLDGDAKKLADEILKKLEKLEKEEHAK